ncbi:hypothetical protein [Actinacidiphila glaucinigra]|uniref:hypothetical protein n=1 Tax=Actinacidiphila glaucinigra TaxID=235986 RepID=UPI00366DE586
MTAPTIGRIVHYRLTEQDANDINRRRKDATKSNAGADRTGFVLHTGNHALEGQLFPAIVVRVFNETTTTANLKVLLDGNDVYWATSRAHGDEPGRWTWPEVLS